jgi:hypothetical protein
MIGFPSQAANAVASSKVILKINKKIIIKIK